MFKPLTLPMHVRLFGDKFYTDTVNFRLYHNYLKYIINPITGTLVMKRNIHQDARVCDKGDKDQRKQLKAKLQSGFQRLIGDLENIRSGYCLQPSEVKLS